MANRSKAKGYRAEVEVVETLRSLGCKAERAWGSNGKARGWHEEVDVEFEARQRTFSVQVKSRRKLPDYIAPNENVFMQVIKQDRGPLMAVLPLERLITLIRQIA